MPLLRFIVGGLLLLLVVSGAMVWLTLSGYFIAKRTPEQLADLLMTGVEVRRPEGEGPFPAIVMFHGCAGIWRGETRRSIMDDYAEIAVSEGVVAVIVDSLRPRGIGFAEAVQRVCQGWSLRGAERAGDVVVGFDIARGLPMVDENRIALAGWSHGGWAVMDALAMNPASERPHNLVEWPPEPFAGLVAVHLTYPYCGFPALSRGRGWHHPVPVEAILVPGDVLADPASCETAFDAIRRTGSTVELFMADGATHAFDERDLGSGVLVYDAEMAQEARSRFAGFLRRHLAAD